GGAPAETHAGDKKKREQQVAHERVAEEHPGRRRSVLRQTHSQRLDETGEIFRIPRIGQPRKRVGNPVEKRRSGKRGRDDGPKRGAPSDGEPEQTDKREGKIAAEDQRVEERCAVV